MRAFVIALEREAQTVRPWLGPADRLFVSGVGKVNAAAATAEALCAGADEIVNVGVCGGFGSAVEVGGIYGVDRAVEYDFDLAELNRTAVGVLNEYETPYLECDRRPALEALAGFGGWRTLATGDHFNNGEADYTLISETLGASLRDMEGAAVAHVCKRAGKRPPLLVKCVTNVAGKGPMLAQFGRNESACLARLSEAMKAFLA